jgi:hypothetical protein
MEGAGGQHYGQKTSTKTADISRFCVRREGVMTLKRIMASIGALRSTLGRSPEEKVDAADLDFNAQMHGV